MSRCTGNYTKLRADTQDKRRKSEILVPLYVDKYEVNKCFFIKYQLVRLLTATLGKKIATKLNANLNLFTLP